jgi:ABC-type branched-chain amino acid transport systems, ATPase component
MADNKNNAPILELRKLCRYFGGLKAVHEVDLVLEAYALNGLIGPNGSADHHFQRYYRYLRTHRR